MKRLKILLMLAMMGAGSYAMGAGPISMMTYNVENLFDTLHDEGKDDYTYLPLSEKNTPEHKRRCKKIKSKRWRRQCLKWDWNQNIVDIKMKRIADVILREDHGRGPDVIFLEEVENIKVLRELVSKYLPNSGYQTVELIEGVDKRGIDPAILSRFALTKPAELHAIPFNPPGGRDIKSRGILEVNLKIPQGGTLTAFAVHFPSPRNPNILRRQAMTFLNELGREAARSSQIVVAAGDFNVTSEEDHKIYREIASQVWDISHYVGCQQCSGTNFYFPKSSWSFLDAIMVIKNTRAIANFPKWELDTSSIRIPTSAPHQSKNKKPLAFDVKTKQGITDHFPIVLRMTEKVRTSN